MPASKIAMASCYTNRCKAVFLRRESIVMVRNSAWNGEGEFVAKMGLPNPKGFGLEVFYGEADQVVDYHLQFYPVIPVLARHSASARRRENGNPGDG